MLPTVHLMEGAIHHWKSTPHGTAVTNVLLAFFHFQISKNLLRNLARSIWINRNLVVYAYIIITLLLMVWERSWDSWIVIDLFWSCGIVSISLCIFFLQYGIPYLMRNKYLRANQNSGQDFQLDKYVRTSLQCFWKSMR